MAISIIHPPIEKRPKDREIHMSANCAEILQFLMAQNETHDLVNKPYIAEMLNMPMRNVQASLIGLQKIGLVEKYEHNFYRFIPQEDTIKFKELYMQNVPLKISESVKDILENCLINIFKKHFSKQIGG